MANELTVFIDGREAIPVRAIPYITGWKSSPDDVAAQLAKKVGAPFEKFPNTYAHRLSDGVPAKILPKQWDEVVAQLEALEADIRARHSNENTGYAEWLATSVAKLPAGVFVWLDEFTKDEPFGKRTLGEQRDGDYDLVTAPLLTSAQRKAVFEGFEKHLGEVQASDTASAVGIAYLKKPDWSEWGYTPNAMLWQACALSMNKDPYSMTRPDIALMANEGLYYLANKNFANSDEKAEFKKRLRILIGNRDARAVFPTRRPNVFGTKPSPFCEITISEFARWAVSVVKWENLPPELVEMAQHEKAQGLKKPDWDIWRTKEKVMVWQAPLLSLDRDPDSIAFGDVHWFGILNKQLAPQDKKLPPEIDDNFKECLWLLWQALHSSTKYFPDDEYHGFPQLQDEVPLGAFAAWCALSNLKIPPPLAKIGEAYGGVLRLQDEATERRKDEVIGWHDVTLDAAMYFDLKSIPPHEAAMLLCRFNPNKTKYDDAISVTTDETSPDDLKRLLRVFEDEHNADSKPRTLRQWHDIAHIKQLMHHSWICRYSEAKATGEVNANSDDTKAAPAESKAQSEADEKTDGLTKREKQIRAIEAEITTLKYSPLEIPDGGKPKIQAACKKNYVALFGAGNDPFKEAWQCGVGAQRFRMANHHKYAKK